MHQPLSFLLVLKPVLGNWMHGRLRQPTPPAAHAHPRRLSPLTQLPTCRQQPRMSLSARPTQTPTVPAALAAEAPRSPAKPQTPRQPDPEVATRFRYPPLPPSAKTQPPACTRPPRPPADAAVARQSPAPSNTKGGYSCGDLRADLHSPAGWRSKERRTAIHMSDVQIRLRTSSPMLGATCPGRREVQQGLEGKLTWMRDKPDTKKETKSKV
ncbi:uncharacterized protein [Manis javanica]|uniref:uncharacterized protein isoform X3 n=1 Tax=Manis javanica TaxID=9974 RepID=UPI001879FB50|nr:extensin-like isoform X3 [Manis javanica]